MDTKIVNALNNLRPNALWILRGTEIEWKDSRQRKPTQDEIDAEIVRADNEFLNTTYQRQRVLEYPPVTDYIDAVYWQTQGDETKMVKYLAAVTAVKTKYPKSD